MVLDDLVLDVRSFKSEHPGGQFLIEFNIGRDISKFFYGSYVLENNSGSMPYIHSNVARSIVNSLIIGRMSHKANKFTATVESKTVLNSTSSVFILRSINNMQQEGQHMQH